MATVAISGLPAATGVAGADVTPIVQSATTKKVTFSAIFAAPPAIGGTTPAAGAFTTGSFTGLVDISAAGAGQIKFPATQNASANANTLDDYEEGTWTPVLTPGTSGSITPNATFTGGAYTKIGNTVVANCIITVTSVSSPVGTLSITGLPFTSTSGNTSYRCGSVSMLGMGASSTGYMATLGPSTTVLTIYTRYAAGAASTDASDVVGGADIRVSITYQT